MNLRQGIEEAIAALEELQSPSDKIRTHRVKWQGREFPCSITTERRGEIVQLGGITSEVSLTIHLRKSLLGPSIDASSTRVTADSDRVTADNSTLFPAPNHSIELLSWNRTYTIVQVRLDSVGACFHLDVCDGYRP